MRYNIFGRTNQVYAQTPKQRNSHSTQLLNTVTLDGSPVQRYIAPLEKRMVNFSIRSPNIHPNKLRQMVASPQTRFGQGGLAE
jgi:hypothetical protein